MLAVKGCQTTSFSILYDITINSLRVSLTVYTRIAHVSVQCSLKLALKCIVTVHLINFSVVHACCYHLYIISFPFSLSLSFQDIRFPSLLIAILINHTEQLLIMLPNEVMQSIIRNFPRDYIMNVCVECTFPMMVHTSI